MKKLNINIGFCGILTIVLIVLKLMGEIAIGWGWVFAPIWIPIVLVIAIIAITIVLSLFLIAGFASIGYISGLFGDQDEEEESIEDIVEGIVRDLEEEKEYKRRVKANKTST